jgi:hypothetical protein
MDLMTLIQKRYSDFVDLCREHKVNKMYAFGSSITDGFDPESSDIDIVVSVDIDDPADRGEALLSTSQQSQAPAVTADAGVNAAYCTQVTPSEEPSTTSVGVAAAVNRTATLDTAASAPEPRSNPW